MRERRWVDGKGLIELKGKWERGGDWESEWLSKREGWVEEGSNVVSVPVNALGSD